jgi:KTSC domain
MIRRRSKEEKMERSPVDSNLLKNAGYDAHAQILEVEFPRGGVYQYLGFPQEKWEAFNAAESKGKYYLKEIKPVHACKKVPDEAPKAVDAATEKG